MPLISFVYNDFFDECTKYLRSQFLNICIFFRYFYKSVNACGLCFQPFDFTFKHWNFFLDFLVYLFRLTTVYKKNMIRFVLRNGRDMAAACARLLMKDEWEIYVAWQREWLSAVAGKEKRQKQVRQFMQMTAEYWQSTQPSRSNKQWKAMAEVVNPSQLSDKHLELIKLVS